MDHGVRASDGGVTGLLQFTHNPNSAQTFYRTLGQTQIY